MGSPWTKRVLAVVVGAVVVAGAGVAVFLPAAPHRSGMASSAVAGGVTGAVAPLARPPANAGRAASASGAGVGASAGGAGVGASAGGVAASSPDAGVAGTAGVVGPPSPPAAVPADTVVRTGTLDVEVARGGFGKAFSTAAGVARSVGGFVVSAEMGPGSLPVIPDGVGSLGPSPVPAITAPSTVPTGGGTPPTVGTLVLRVPGTQFDKARVELEALGTLRGENLSGQDAGGQLADLNARLADLHAEQDGLRTMAQRAVTTADLLAIQAQLAGVQQQIDGLTAQQSQLQNQVALASITITLHEVVPAVASPPSRSILDARLAQAGRGVEAMTGGMLVVLAYAGPLVAVAGLVVLGLLGVRRRRADRRPAIT